MNIRNMKKLAIALAFLPLGVLAEPVTYSIDPMHTAPRFEYNHFGLSSQIQRFDKTTGVIVYDAAARTGSVDISIDVASINTGVPLLNEHLQGEAFFDVAHFPTITYKSTRVEFKDGKPAEVEGNLTVKGITRPVTLEITSFDAKEHPMRHKPALGANAVAHIKRTDFNMGKYVPNVSDDVTLNIAVEAAAQ